MKYLKYLIMFAVFYSLSGCYTQLAINGRAYGDDDYSVYQEPEYNEDSTEVAYSDSTEYDDFNDWDENYYRDRDNVTVIYGSPFVYRGFYTYYYPRIIVDYDPYYYDWYWVGYRCGYFWDPWLCDPYYSYYYDPYFYNPYWNWSYYNYGYGGGWWGGVNPVKYRRSRSLSHLRNSHGGRGGLVFRLPGKSRGGRASDVRDRHNGRSGVSRQVEIDKKLNRPSVNAMGDLGKPSVNKNRGEARVSKRRVKKNASVYKARGEKRTIKHKSIRNYAPPKKSKPRKRSYEVRKRKERSHPVRSYEPTERRSRGESRSYSAPRRSYTPPSYNSGGSSRSSSSRSSSGRSSSRRRR
jgi:hypothetical protein